MAVAVGAAVLAAVFFALAAVLQQRAAQREPAENSLRPRLILDLARRPVWVAGVATAVGAYGLQALALSFGPLALVQPIVTADLLFALLIAVRLYGGRIGRQEVGGALLVSGGTAAFLLIGQPTQGTFNPALTRWSLVGVATVSGVALALAGARVARGSLRASLLAVSSGITFGLLAVLTKTVTGLLATGGVEHTFSTWQPYALGVVGLGGLLLVQSAFQAGPLAVVLPVADIVEPAVATLIGIMAFDERMRSSPGALLGEAVAAAGIALGIFVLDRSPLVRTLQEGMAPPAPGRALQLVGADESATPAPGLAAGLPAGHPADTPTASPGTADWASPAAPRED